MRRVQASEAERDLQAVLKSVGNEPVSIESCGKPVAIVLSPEAYVDLLMRCGARSPRSHRALTTDSNELFGLSGDVFCNDAP